MAQKRQNDSNYSFLMEHGSVQILFMLDDTYYMDYGAAVSWKTYLDFLLRRDGYRLIMGMERIGRRYKFWTMRSDKVSDYIYKNPSEAGKDWDELLKAVEVVESGAEGKAKKSLAMFGSRGLPIGKLKTGPAAESRAPETSAPETSAPEIGAAGALEKKTAENPRHEFAAGKEAAKAMEFCFPKWTRAKEPFVFIASASDWLKLLEEDKKENGGQFGDICEEIFWGGRNNGILLLTIRPIPGWIEIYNKVLDMMKRWEVSSPKTVSPKDTSDSKWQVQDLARQNEGIVRYIPSVTAENVEKMLLHEYLMRRPEFPLDFSRVEEEANELVYLMNLEKDGREGLPVRVEQICRLDQTRPLSNLCSYLNRNEMKREFDEYLKMRAPRYRSWGDVPVQKIKELEKHLLSEFVGEDHAIREFCRELENCIKTCAKRNRLREDENVSLDDIRKGPPSVIFLAGPSRTGKSDVARETVKFLFGNLDRFFDKFNGEILKTGEASRVILGSPPGTKGYGEENAFRQFLRRGTCGLLLVDEIDEASEDVKSLFMKMTEETAGSLTFTTQETLFLSEILVVFTSNNGCKKSVTEESMPDYETLCTQVKESFKRDFKDAWQNRVKKLIIYDYLRPDAASETVFKIVEKKKKEFLESENHINLRLTEEAFQHLILTGCRERVKGYEHMRDSIKNELNNAMEGERYIYGSQVLEVAVLNGKLTAKYL